MHKIIAIGLNTFRESARDKIFYSLLAFAILIIGFSVVLGNLSLGDTYKIIQDFGLMALSLFGVLTAIFVGIGMVYKEMEKRTVFVLLSKPIARWQFVLGKYLGLSLTLLIMQAVMTLFLFGVCLLYQGKVPYAIIYAVVAIAFELQLILAAAVFFSTFTTPFLSGLFTLALFIIGHISVDLKVIAAKFEDSTAKTLIDALYYLLPNLEKLNFKAAAVHRLAIDWSGYAGALAYALVYSAMILCAAVLVFNRRDMK
jgi:ABC-type transport system involved in multi-copper enzyme maturation permease subunit